jgi:hypothetical protein
MNNLTEIARLECACGTETMVVYYDQELDMVNVLFYKKTTLGKLRKKNYSEMCFHVTEFTKLFGLKDQIDKINTNAISEVFGSLSNHTNNYGKRKNQEGENETRRTNL